MPDFAPLISLAGQKKKGFTPLTARTPQTMDSGQGSGAGGETSSEKSTGREESKGVGGADASGAGMAGKAKVSDGGNQIGSVREVGIRDVAVCGKAPVVTMHRDTDDPSRIVGVRITCGCGEVTDVTFEYAEALPPQSGIPAGIGTDESLNTTAASQPESGMPGVSGLEDPGKESDNPA